MTADRPLPSIALAAMAAGAGAALVLLGVVQGGGDAVVAVLIAAGLLVGVRVPWGGDVSIGYVAVTATLALLPHREATATLAVALTVGAVLVVCRRPRQEAVAIVERCAGSMAGALALVLAIDLATDGDLPTLACAIGAAAGVIVGDLATTRLRSHARLRIDLRGALPVHLTLACAGILIAVAVDGVGVAMASVAAFPLLITRFSFDRYADATDTLEQTVQALGLVPELAGLAPLGHSERAAIYANAVGRELGLDRAALTRVVTVTRLHHIGAVPYDVDPEHEGTLPVGEIASHGARIIRESGLPDDVADLLASANADSLDALAPTLEAAVVRVAATFDELVGDDVDAADRGLALVSGAARDPYSRRAAAALLELLAGGDDLVRDAVAAGARFCDAAVGLDLQDVTAGRGTGEILPFKRRP